MPGIIKRLAVATPHSPPESLPANTHAALVDADIASCIQAQRVVHVIMQPRSRDKQMNAVVPCR